MRIPALSDGVVFTDATGEKHAATIARDPDPDSMYADLTVHWYNGETVFPLRGVPFSAEGAADSWSWPTGSP